MTSALPLVDLRAWAQQHQGKSPIDLPLTRRDLADMFACAGFHAGAEIGVERGLFSETLCQANPHLSLLCVDAWQTWKGYREHVTQAKLDGFYREAQQRLAPYRCTLVRRFSVDAAAAVPDRSLDFVYIDASHRYQDVVQDLAAWTPKVRSGGVVAGHDYRRSKGDGPFHVVQAVTGWTSAYQIAPWFVCRGDHAPSWFWIV